MADQESGALYEEIRAAKQEMLRRRQAEQDALDAEAKEGGPGFLSRLALGLASGYAGNEKKTYDGGRIVDDVYDSNAKQAESRRGRRVKAIEGYDSTLKGLIDLYKTRSQELISEKRLKEQEAREEKRDARKFDHDKEMAGLKNNPAKVEFERLPPEAQEEIKDVTKKTANKVSIANQLDAASALFDDPTIPEEQKVKAGQNLLKVINSAEGQDAVGAEEAKRLGSFLEFKIGNITQPGSFVGRDLEKFGDQVKIASATMKDGIARNRARVNELYGRSPGYRQTQIPNDVKRVGENRGSDIVPNAMAGNTEPMVKVIGGKTYVKVPGGWQEVR